MRKPAWGPALLATIITVVSGYMAWKALSFPFRPRLGPLAFAGLTCVLAVSVLVVELLDIRRLRKGADIEPESPDEDLAPARSRPTTSATAVLTRPEVVAFGWLAVLVTAFFLLGFMVGMTAFMVLMMKVYGRERWPVTLLVTGIVMASTYVLFVRVLGVRVYEGLVNLPFF